MHRIGAPSDSRLPRRSRLVPPARSYLLVRRQATCNVPPSTRETPPIHPAPRPPTRPHRHDHREGGGLPCRVRAPACARVRAREAGRRLRGPADLLQRHRAMARRRVSDRIRFPPKPHPGTNARGKDTQCRHLSGQQDPGEHGYGGTHQEKKDADGHEHPLEDPDADSRQDDDNQDEHDAAHQASSKTCAAAVRGD